MAGVSPEAAGLALLESGSNVDMTTFSCRQAVMCQVSGQALHWME